MTIGKSGFFEASGSKGFTVRVNWAETYDVSTNKSVVSITSVQVKSSMYFDIFYLNGTISIDGRNAITMNSGQGTHTAYLQNVNTYATASGNMGSVSDIEHNTDGSKSVSISVSISGFNSSQSGGNGWSVSGSGTIELTTIPRAATITSATDVTLGNACSIAWTPAATSFRYRLEFWLGGWSYTTELLHPNTTSSYTYTGYVIPMDVAYHITDTPTDVMKATLYTYSDSDGAMLLGEDTEEFTVTVPDNEETKPAVGMELYLVNDLPYPFDTMYIQNLTKVSASIDADGQYGAGIELLQMVIGGNSYGDPYVSGYLTQTGDVTVTGKATDSRGYVGKTERIIHVIPYAKPAIVPVDGETHIVCVRCDASGNITDSGTYLKVKAARRYSKVISEGVQHNTCRFQYRVNGGSWIPIPADSDELDTKLSGVVTSTTNAYSIDIGVVDDLKHEDFASFIVPSDQVEFHLREGGDGAAFGEYAEDAKVLAVAESWKLKVKGDLIVGGGLEIDGSLSVGSLDIDGGLNVGGDLNVGGNLTVEGDTPSGEEPTIDAGRLLNLIYPVGSIYMSVNAVSPATFLGGTWERIQDKFLLSAGSTYEPGSSGGEATHTLTENEMPSHKHDLAWNDANPLIASLSGNKAGASSATAYQQGYRMTYATSNVYPDSTIALPVGGGSAHNNMPPYLAVYVWQRTA